MEQGKLGKYDIRGTLGRSAMGVVYEVGTDMSLVIAASSPVLKIRRPPDERQDRYLHDLQVAIAIAQGGGVRLAGQAIVRETTEH
jgi:hypothetical protein